MKLNNPIILQGQGQEKKSLEESLLLSPVKKTRERYCCYTKILKHGCEVRSLREERHIYGKLRLNMKTAVSSSKSSHAETPGETNLATSKAKAMYSKPSIFQFHNFQYQDREVQQDKRFKLLEIC